MKKVLSLLLLLALCLGLCACGSDNGSDKGSDKNNPMVGTWHTYAMGVTTTYTFKANGKYTLSITGALNMESSGTYTYNNTGWVTLCDKDSGEAVDQKVSLHVKGCYMVLNEVEYGRAYSESEPCEALDVILGKWVHTTLEGTYLTFNKDGTCSLTTPSGTDTGIYIYNPFTEKVTIPNGDLVFIFEDNGNKLSATNQTGFYFER